jgi:hypothetical protein
MSETVLKIEKLANGYTVEVPDAKVQKANRNPKVPYQDPWKEYVFPDATKAAAFVAKVLGSLEPVEDDMATEFDRATAED